MIRGLAAEAILGPVVSVSRRLGSLVLVLWGTVTLTFFAVHAAPGDIVRLLIGQGHDTPEVRAVIAAEWGLDRPLLVQYAGYLGRLLHGDLGTSYVLKRPVTEVIGAQLASTVELAVTATALAALLTILITTLTAGRRLLTRLAGAGELLLASTPEFWVGILLLFVFSFTLPWFPVAGAGDLSALVLPSLTLALGAVGGLAPVLRDGLERALEQPFALTVRSRGVSDLGLRVRHGLRHASIPTLNLAGFAVGNLLGGAVIVEQVFGRPGIGQVALRAISSKDIPTILGVALLAAFVFVVVSTVVDLLSLVIDPRLVGAAS
ncbi:ABC transporter permease [Frankia sp. CNm7]|uniref:ABC transporter permease n=1 Tax=Frankia nepalensis TaxID=1836974 RepID=A0A937UT10_9ACTN|nr:ABC transporter permease [Frankia nepalensis]MBL7498943.1 ABC transporter permease [Frankia nepalensis]MBL7511260.1 ABC transporter permease [Frankia nepalensis]MBL7520566.1 ABC transporter permease [Frankia nepalensis]MBL7630780.1 ABC transporter permease [Frankia nepalensis]